MAQHSRTAKQDIAAAAYRLFLTNGYSQTSYRDIAEAVGRDRAIVQYHFPRKEMLVVGCLQRLIELIESHIATNNLADREPMRYRVAIAQIYFSVLMHPDIRIFTRDVLSSRAITQEVLVMEANWNLVFLDVRPGERREAFDQALIAVGGAYELMYRYIITGDELDVRSLAVETIANSVPGHRTRDAEPRVPGVGHDPSDAHELGDTQLVAATREVLGALIGEGRAD